MNQNPYKVSLISPAEADLFLRSIRTPENKEFRKSLVLSEGFELKGEFSLIAKNHLSQEIEWEVHQPNLLTDYGRRAWMDYRFSSLRIAFCPSIEAPNPGRYSVSTDGSANASFVSANVTPTVAPTTYTKTISATFTTPSANRTLGMIALIGANVNADVTLGLVNVCAFSLLTPAKSQTTTQTLEVIYKISMNPIS